MPSHRCQSIINWKNVRTRFEPWPRIVPVYGSTKTVFSRPKLKLAAVAGSLLIETLFSLDGLGLLSYESVIRRDYPVVFGTLFMFTIIGLLTTLLRDLSYLWVDPRVRFFD